MFTDQEIRDIRTFIQSVNENLIPIDSQEAVVKDGNIWCADWWNIECCKCLIYGEDAYRLDPLPRVLKNNPLFEHNYHVTTAGYKLKMFELLREHKGFADTLLVCECGRGIDILLANMVQSWKKIYCYDHSGESIKQVIKYFKDRLGYPVEAVCSSSWSYPENHLNPKGYAGIDYKMVILANVTKVEPHHREQIKANSNLLGIFNGELLK